MNAVPKQASATRSEVDIPPVLPLALLESVRAHDRPGEILEEENYTVSLPRRLGLTGVVESQIMQYQQAAKKGRRVPLDDVANLMRLVLRRPDAEAIMRETGQRVARVHFQKVPAAWARSLRLMPKGVVFAAVRRSARRMLTRFMGEEKVVTAGKPLALRASDSVTAFIDPAGTTCVLYGGALEELVYLYTQTRPRIVHHVCKTRGNPHCEWVLSE